MRSWLIALISHIDDAGASGCGGEVSGLVARRGGNDAALPGAAAVRHERPARQREAARRLPASSVLEQEGIPTQTFALEPQRAEHRRAAEGQRQEAAAPAHGAHRRRQRRSGEVDASRRSARRATAVTSTAAAPSTTRTTSSRR